MSRYIKLLSQLMSNLVGYISYLSIKTMSTYKFEKLNVIKKKFCKCSSGGNFMRKFDKVLYKIGMQCQSFVLSAFPSIATAKLIM